MSGSGIRNPGFGLRASGLRLQDASGFGSSERQRRSADRAPRSADRASRLPDPFVVVSAGGRYSRDNCARRARRAVANEGEPA